MYNCFYKYITDFSVMQIFRVNVSVNFYNFIQYYNYYED